MGKRGTEVARQASDLVLADDDGYAAIRLDRVLHKDGRWWPRA